MPILFRLSAIFAVLTLFACTHPSPDPPICRVSNSLVQVQQNIDQQAQASPIAAACLIKANSKVLLVEHRLSGKFDFPGGGRGEGESLACTAHRETWEETGFNVEVSQYLLTTKNGLVLFGCQLDAGLENLPDKFEAPRWAQVEITGLAKIDPFVIDQNAMRFADDLIPLRDGYTQFVINQP
jgi:phosphatase NudJ